MNLNEPINGDNIENEKLELIMLSFETSDELIKGTRAFFSERGYGLSIRSSRKDKYVVLGCDRGGCYRDQRNISIDQIKRTTASRLTDCPFKIKGKRQDNGLWMIEIKNYLHNQHMKAKLGTMSAVCSGKFTKTMGLPCAHKMSNWRNEPLILDLIHSQWRIDGRSLSVYAATHNDDHDDGFDVILEELRTKYQEWPASAKDAARERIKELINQFDVPFEPISRPPKGRPPKSKNKRKAVSSTRRDPSGFEFVEASRQSGLGEGLDHGNASLFDLNVSSSMWE